MSATATGTKPVDGRGWEGVTAKERLADEQVLDLLDYPKYFELLGLPLPENRVGILSALESDNLIGRMAGTRVTLLSPRPLGSMTPDERAHAVYLHACLNQVSRKDTTNSSIRQRFGIEEKNKSIASRLIKEALDRGLVVAYDKNAGPRSRRYIPLWAAGLSGPVT